MVDKTLKEFLKEAKKRLNNGTNEYYKKEKTENYSNLIDYDAVLKIVDSGEIISDPIQRLMNKEYYNSLNLAEKQRYILNISSSYIAIKRKYQAEKLKHTSNQKN